MKDRIKAALTIIFVLALISPAYARGFECVGPMGLFDSQPGPWLLYPASEEVDLSEKDSLEFKWLRTSLIGVDHYDFRLYKGYNIYGQDLVFRQNVPYNAYSIKVKSGLLENNQVYTWCVVRVCDNGQKSEKSFHSFRIIKK